MIRTFGLEVFHVGHGLAIMRIVEISRVDYPGLLIYILLLWIEMIPVDMITTFQYM